MKLRPGAKPHLRTPFAWRGGRVLQLFAGLVLALGLAACSEEEAPLEKQKVHPVKLLSLSDEGGGVIQRYPGVVEASERSNLSFRIGGELRELKVQAGQEVEKGELIARLDDRDARSELNNARSSLNCESVLVGYECANRYSEVCVSLGAEVSDGAAVDPSWSVF